MAVKINRIDLAHVEVAFVSTYLRAGTEDRILVYSDGQGRLLFEQPEMDRHRGEVTCDVELTIEAHGRLWDLVFDLHSHHVMGAFWSPTDDANERLRGPVFGVFTFKDNQPKWLFRRFTGQEYESVPYGEVVGDG